MAIKYIARDLADLAAFFRQQAEKEIARRGGKRMTVAQRMAHDATVSTWHSAAEIVDKTQFSAGARLVVEENIKD